MYKIAFVVAVFAFALQGALSKHLVDPAEMSLGSDVAGAAAAASPLTMAKSASAVENKPVGDEEKQSTDKPTTTPSPSASSTTESGKKSGASSSEICVLLVQVSSLALVVKHALL